MGVALLKPMAPVFCLVLNVLLQVFCVRRLPRLSLLESVYLGFSFGLMALSLIGFYAYFRFRMALGDYLGFCLASVLAYGCLSYCYFHFINLGETARRIRILRELYDAGEGLSYRQLLELYNARTILDVRLKRLLESGQIKSKDEKYFIHSPLVLLFSRMILVMKKALYGKDYRSII